MHYTKTFVKLALHLTVSNSKYSAKKCSFFKVLLSSRLSLHVHLNYFCFPLSGHCMVDIKENSWEGTTNILTSI
jgi:hypothetical protein